jgi:hypothetical protein
MEDLKKYFDRDEIKSFYQPKKVDEVILKDGWNTFNTGRKQNNIYIPTYYRFEKTKRCIESIVKAQETSKNVYLIYVGDNNTQGEEREKLINFLDTCPTVTSYFHTENIGKARMVNLLHAKYTGRHNGCCLSHDYIFSIDSDMVLIPPPDKSGDLSYRGINQLDGMIELMERGHNIGLVSSFQTGQSEHWFGRSVAEKKERGYRIGESKTGVGIAGGCICMERHDWKRVGGYEENYDIYTADDAILMEKVDKILKKRAVVGIDFPLYHPPNSEDDPGYVKWKRDRFLKDGLKYYEQEYQKEKYGKGYYDT